MTTATGSRSQVAYIQETTFGTTPATPQLTALPFISWNVNLTKDEYDDNSIRSDRMERYSVSGNRHLAGEFDINYQPLNYDTFLEGLLYNTWSGNTLKVGTTSKSFTMEEAALDISQYRVYTGVMVDKFNINIPNNGLITAKFNVIGKDQSALSGATIDTDGSVAPATVSSPMTHTGTNGFFKIGGSSVGYITALSLTVDNGMSSNYALGVATAHSLTPGFIKVTGTATVFFEDAVAYNLFINGTQSSIDFKLDNGTNTHEFSLPNVKFVGATKTITGQGPISMSFTYKALYDATSGSNIVITRT